MLHLPCRLALPALVAAHLWAGCTIDFRRHFVEECGNGVDDDEDGAIDCEDEDCGAAACVPAAPEGWDGPIVVIYDADACPDGSPPEASGTLCLACACEGSVQCGSALVSFGDCAGTFEETLGTGDGTCVDDLGVSGGASGARGEALPLTSSCVATGSGSLRSGVLCAAGAGAGCPDGTSCVAPSDGACVARDGDWPCPDGFPSKRSFAEGEVAACTPCDCQPSPPACGGVTTLFTGNGCTGTTTAVTHDALSCAVLPQTPQSATFAPGSPPTCAPAGGLPEGVASVRTLCCAL